MSKLFNVSASPHIRCEDTTNSIMADVAIALIPAGIFGVYNFGLNALLVILVSVVTCLLTEYFYERFMKKPITTSDCSALVTGLLLAYNLPSTVPLWIPIIGGIFAILVVKQVFGGLGQNFMNPALAARCFLLISFAGIMTSYSIPADSSKKGLILNGMASINGYAMVDGVSGATPLAIIKSGESFDLVEMFLGTTAGCIGEVSVAAVLIGAVYMLFRRIISLRIPLTYIGTFAIFITIVNIARGNGFDADYIVGNLFGGGLMLGAFFMATDYVTSPITPNGKIVFGVLLGVLTGIFRVFGNSAEGVSFAIIICNMLVPLIEKATIPKFFGKEASE